MVTVEKIKSNEIERVVEIWLEASLVAHSFVDSRFWIENQDLMRQKYLPNSELFVCRVKDDIVGFISLVDKRIEALFVDIVYQGKGWGSALLNHAKNNYDSLSLSVFKENENAVKFYKKSGFTEVEERRNIDVDRVEIVMKWEK